MKYLLMSICLVLFSACSISTPSKVEYEISVHPKLVTYPKGRYSEKSLKVSTSFSSRSLMSNTMYYNKEKYKRFAFTQSAWAQIPNRAINQNIFKVVKSSHIFKNVVNYKSILKSDFILESNIEEFTQYFNTNSTKSFVILKISMTLIEAKSTKLIASHSFTKKVDVNILNAESGVNALNKVLEDVLQESNEWLFGVCK